MPSYSTSLTVESSVFTKSLAFDMAPCNVAPQGSVSDWSVFPKFKENPSSIACETIKHPRMCKVFEQHHQSPCTCLRQQLKANAATITLIQHVPPFGRGCGHTYSYAGVVGGVFRKKHTADAADDVAPEHLESRRLDRIDDGGFLGRTNGPRGIHTKSVRLGTNVFPTGDRLEYWE